MPVAVWCLGALALAADDRERLADAWLQEAAHGNTPGAISIYEELVRRLADDDPLRGEALFWLARAQHRVGEVGDARRTLVDGIRSGLCPTRCRDLLERIELETARIQRLPTTWAFDDANHGLLHPWRFQDRGHLRLTDDGSLIWQTTPQPRQPDRLVAALGAVGAVTEVQLTLQSPDAAVLQVVWIDIDDRRYGLRDAIHLTPGERHTVRLPMSAWVSLDGDDALPNDALAALWFVDVTPTSPSVTYRFETFTVR